MHKGGKPGQVPMPPLARGAPNLDGIRIAAADQQRAIRILPGGQPVAPASAEQLAHAVGNHGAHHGFESVEVHANILHP